LSSGLGALPHEIPFRAVSRITPVDDKSARGLFLPSANDALPGVTPELMLIEAMAQVGGSIVFRNPGERGLLSGLDDVEMHGSVEPGDRIEIEVKLEVELGGLYRLSGTARRDDTLIVSARFYLASEDRAGQTRES
jgi:3-hydroxymyristoyl/3-hydroxydecanoyl-(acyl carrier protein) dehydratase